MQYAKLDTPGKIIFDELKISDSLLDIMNLTLSLTSMFDNELIFPPS
jgi:hypothetical protein